MQVTKNANGSATFTASAADLELLLALVECADMSDEDADAYKLKALDGLDLLDRAVRNAVR